MMLDELDRKTLKRLFAWGNHIALSTRGSSLLTPAAPDQFQYSRSQVDVHFRS
jgi:hypothetical protein